MPSGHSRLLKHQLATASSLLAPQPPSAPATKRSSRRASRKKKGRAAPAVAAAPAPPKDEALAGYWRASIDGKAAQAANEAARRALGL